MEDKLTRQWIINVIIGAQSADILYLYKIITLIYYFYRLIHLLIIQHITVDVILTQAVEAEGCPPSVCNNISAILVVLVLVAQIFTIDRSIVCYTHSIYKLQQRHLIPETLAPLISTYKMSTVCTRIISL